MVVFKYYIVNESAVKLLNWATLWVGGKVLLGSKLPRLSLGRSGKKKSKTTDTQVDFI